MCDLSRLSNACFCHCLVSRESYTAYFASCYSAAVCVLSVIKKVVNAVVIFFFISLFLIPRVCRRPFFSHHSRCFDPILLLLIRNWPMQLVFNRLRFNSHQRQISLCNINAFSVREVMRIKDMITQLEFRW